MSSKESDDTDLNDVSDLDRKTFNDMFVVFDFNGNGSVDSNDVKQAFKAASGRDVPDDEIKKMIEDAGGSDNKLNQAQFVSMMVKLKTSTPTRRELTDSFAVFDKSGSKNINCKEFKKAMKEMGATPMKDSEVDKFIAHANPEDTSGFSYDALIEVMASQKADKIPWMEKAPSE